jgi:5-dehydro-4-deoxyglucarate dehydratase
MPTAEMTFPAYHALGCQGYSSALSNFAPHITLRFHAAVLAGDRATQAEILRHVIEPLCTIRDLRRGYAVAYVKAAVDVLGLLGPEGPGPVRAPLTDLPPDHRERLRAVLTRILHRYPPPPR